ncbi:MAG: histidine phosphatase family protein [Chloroflexota bacterium]|nr:histidine phosphatase family protein [Chloroflexota bacterium]
MLQVYFIRHGQSTNNLFWNETDRNAYLLGRKMDADLTPVGVEQAKLVADYLARSYESESFDPQNRYGFGLTHLYCSLMIRSIKTGKYISEKTGLPLVAWPEFHETGGLFETAIEEGEPIFYGRPGHGKSFFESHFPNLVLPEDLPEDGWWNRDKEPRENYLVRAQDIINRLHEKHSGKDHRVGIVMHGGIFARIMVSFFNVQVEKYWFLMNNCAISRVDLADDSHITLSYMNKVDHLPDHLIT